MFNPSQENSQPEAIWDLMGTFFALLPEDDKKVFETYYESLSRDNSALFYSLYQAEGLRYFKFTEGYYELLYKEFELITGSEDPEKDTLKKEFLRAPSNLEVNGAVGTRTFSYKVTAVNSEGESIGSRAVTVNDTTFPVNLTWDAVPGATSYNIYGRAPKDYLFISSTTDLLYDDTTETARGTDTSPKKSTAFYGYSYKIDNPYFYLTIPKLGDLVEGTHYNIENGNSILFDIGALTLEEDFSDGAFKQTLVSPSSLIVSPVISEFYWKSFGVPLKGVLINEDYTPPIPGYNALPFLEKQKAYSEHIKYFTWALANGLRKKPTISNIEHLYSLASGFPFAYEGGEVTNISTSQITIGDYTYDIGSGTHVFNVGDTVNKFDILATGIELKDWVSDSATIEGLASEEIEPRLAINLINTTAYPFNNDVLKSVKDISIPAGLHLIETTS